MGKKTQNTRKHERINLKTRVNCLTDSKFLSVFSKNLSEGGICIQSLQEIESGTNFDLQIHLPDNNKPVRIRGEVVWANPLNPRVENEGLFDLGIKFKEVNPETSIAIRACIPGKQSGKEH